MKQRGGYALNCHRSRRDELVEPPEVGIVQLKNRFAPDRILEVEIADAPRDLLVERRFDVGTRHRVENRETQAGVGAHFGSPQASPDPRGTASPFQMMDFSGPCAETEI